MSGACADCACRLPASGACLVLGRSVPDTGTCKEYEPGGAVPESRKLAGELLAEALYCFAEFDTASSDRLLAAFTAMRELAGRYPTRIQILKHVREEWGGSLPKDGTKRLAERLGLSERWVNQHLNAIVRHPVLGTLVSWQKIHGGPSR